MGQQGLLTQAERSNSQKPGLLKARGGRVPQIGAAMAQAASAASGGGVCPPSVVGARIRIHSLSPHPSPPTAEYSRELRAGSSGKASWDTEPVAKASEWVWRCKGRGSAHVLRPRALS